MRSTKPPNAVTILCMSSEYLLPLTMRWEERHIVHRSSDQRIHNAADAPEDSTCLRPTEGAFPAGLGT